jgi:1,4-dihydroxy-2-naphthoate octaprenyltransferase
MLIGRNASLKLYAFEVLFPFLLVFASVFCGWLPWYSLIVLLAIPKAWQNARTVLSAKKKGVQVLAPVDAATAQLQLIFSLLLTISLFVASVI